MPPADNAIANNPPPESYDDIKPGLSDQELAALSDDDDDEVGDEVAASGDQDSDTENSSASPRPEDQGAENDAAGGDTTDDDDAAQAAAQDAADSADDDDAESGAPPNAEPDDVPRGMQMVTQIRASRQFAQDIDKQITAIDGEMDALEAKLDEGDIQLSEFMRESRRLNNTRQELVADRREQEILQNTNAALYETDWNTSVATFMSDNEQFQNPIMMGALEAALKELYAEPDNVGSSHYWYLETARRAVMEQITPREASRENPPDNAESPQQQRRQELANQGRTRAQQAAKDRQKVPANLAQVPAAEDNPGDDDEFSHLDRLEGVELEQALAKMTDSQVDRYLRAGG